MASVARDVRSAGQSRLAGYQTTPFAHVTKIVAEILGWFEPHFFSDRIGRLAALRNSRALESPASEAIKTMPDVAAFEESASSSIEAATDRYPPELRHTDRRWWTMPFKFAPGMARPLIGFKARPSLA